MTELIDIIINGQVQGTVPAANRANVEMVLNNEGKKFVIRPHVTQEQKEENIKLAMANFDAEKIKRDAARAAEEFRKSTQVTEAHPNVDEPPQIPPTAPKKRVRNNK